MVSKHIEGDAEMVRIAKEFFDLTIEAINLSPWVGQNPPGMVT
jgi:hypothetical protein